MKIILDDLTDAANLYPFTIIRSMVDIRLGILTLREKWKLFDIDVQTTSEGLAIPNDAVLLPGNFIPSARLVNILKQTKVLDEDFEDHLLQYPWQLPQKNDLQLRQDFELLTHNRISAPLPPTVTAINTKDIFIEEGAIVQCCTLNATSGPIYIGKNAEIMEGCLVRGPFALCEGSILKMGSRIYGATTAGPYSVLGGEVKNSILFGYSNKGHDGYLGDSVIGEWCNLGAGTSNSNVKNTGGDIRIWNNAQQTYSSTGTKCGLLMGDYSRAAINTSFNTGTVTGICCNIFTQGFPPKYIPDFSWGNERYELEKVFTDIDNWKKMKGSKITPEEKKILTDLYNNKN